MLKDLLQSSQAVIIERLSSPILGAWGAFWLIFNWKIPLILTWGSGKMEARIELVEKTSDWLQGIAYPFVASVLFLCLYPLLAKYWFMYQYGIARDRQLIKIRNERVVLKNKFDLVELESNLERVRFRAEQYSKETQQIEEHRNRIMQMEQQSDRLIEENSRLKAQVEELTNALNPPSDAR